MIKLDKEDIKTMEEEKSRLEDELHKLQNAMEVMRFQLNAAQEARASDIVDAIDNTLDILTINENRLQNNITALNNFFNVIFISEDEEK